MANHLTLLVDNTEQLADNTGSAMEREKLFQRLLSLPCSFSDDEFKTALSLLGKRIDIQTHNALFIERLKSRPDANSLVNRCLLAIIEDRSESEQLLSRLERITTIGLVQVPPVRAHARAP